MIAPPQTRSGILDGILRLVLERDTLGGRLSPEAGQALRLFVEGMDREVGRPIAEASADEIAQTIETRLFTLLQGSLGAGFLVHAGLKQDADQFARDLGADVFPAFAAQITQGLPLNAAGNLLQSFSTLRRHLPRLANFNGDALMFGMMRYFAGVIAFTNPPVRAPEALALYLRDRANELAALAARKKFTDPTVQAASADVHDEDAVLARAVMALWNRKGSTGDAPIPG